MVTDLDRVVALLRMSRCEVSQVNEFPEVLVVAAFSPTGIKRWVCAVVAPHFGQTALEATAEARSQLVNYKGLDASNTEGYVLFRSGPVPTIEENCAEKIELGNYHELSIDDLCKTVVDAANIHGHFRNMRHQEEHILPLPFQLFNSGLREQDSTETSDAATTLSKLITSSVDTNLFLVSGGFGTGKTSLLREVGYKLSHSEGAMVLPIFVELSGAGSSGVKAAVKAAVAEMFHAVSDHMLEDLQRLVGERIKIVLLFDSLDEQLELNFVETGKIIDRTMEFIINGFICVAAYRPEMFEGNNDALAVIRKHFAPLRGKFYELSLQNLSPVSVRDSIGMSLISVFAAHDLRALAERLSTRPIWFSFIRRFALEVSSGLQEQVSALTFVEYLIDSWAKREKRTNRPLIDPSERDAITTALAFCLHSGHGLRVHGRHEVNRKELIRFIRRVVSLMQTKGQASTVEGSRKWRQIPPDLSAESLAVSNLLVTDRPGNLSFSDSIFLEYYLARGIHRALRREKIVAGADRVLLDIMGLLSPNDLLGAMRFPKSQHRYFFDLLRDMTAREGDFDLVHQSLGKVLELIRPPDENIHVPGTDRLVADYNDSSSAETRKYQIIPMDFWPHAGNVYTADNCIELYLEADRSVRLKDLSYLDLSNSNLSNIEFVGCDLEGTNFTKANLSETKFRQCALSFALFDKSSGITRYTFSEDCSLDQTLFFGIPAFQDRDIRSCELLSSLTKSGEAWIDPPSVSRIVENGNVAISLSRFIADVSPVSNQQFAAFSDKYQDYSQHRHAVAIQNPYYLTLMLPDFDDQPVVYVSLIAAAAYAISVGKRLPSAAEFYAYNSAFSKTAGIFGPVDGAETQYGKLPPIADDGQPYPVGAVTEWSLQIDDKQYWAINVDVGPFAPDRRLGQFPPFRRSELPRCEYFIMGKSFQPKASYSQNAKQATWFNPDQGFRCVLDYSSAVKRKLACKK